MSTQLSASTLEQLVVQLQNLPPWVLRLAVHRMLEMQNAAAPKPAPSRIARLLQLAAAARRSQIWRACTSPTGRMTFYAARRFVSQRLLGKSTKDAAVKTAVKVAVKSFDQVKCTSPAGHTVQHAVSTFVKQLLSGRSSKDAATKTAEKLARQSFDRAMFRLTGWRKPTRRSLQ